jgi:hypothetical protein
MELRSDLDLRAGSRVTIWLPAGEDSVFGPEPFSPGQGFTLDAGGEQWRAVLREAAIAPDGRGASLEIELTDSTPIGYGPTPAP